MPRIMLFVIMHLVYTMPFVLSKNGWNTNRNHHHHQGTTTTTTTTTASFDHGNQMFPVNKVRIYVGMTVRFTPTIHWKHVNIVVRGKLGGKPRSWYNSHVKYLVHDVCRQKMFASTRRQDSWHLPWRSGGWCGKFDRVVHTCLFPIVLWPTGTPQPQRRPKRWSLKAASWQHPIGIERWYCTTLPTSLARQTQQLWLISFMRQIFKLPMKNGLYASPLTFKTMVYSTRIWTNLTLIHITAERTCPFRVKCFPCWHWHRLKMAVCAWWYWVNTHRALHPSKMVHLTFGWIDDSIKMTTVVCCSGLRTTYRHVQNSVVCVSLRWA